MANHTIIIRRQDFYLGNGLRPYLLGLQYICKKPPPIPIFFPFLLNTTDRKKIHLDKFVGYVVLDMNQHYNEYYYCRAKSIAPNKS